nr:callose synthase 7-like isoform X1 [Ipomoea batatas]GMC76760.1 callose synthase 7-like isoform X1 [Ipomoea batatas]
MFHIHLNILACSAFLKQIKAALRAIRNMDNLPIIRTHDGSKDKSTNDILEWLASAFGFQKGNVANQREHLVLLLANMDVRNKGLEDHENYDQVIDLFSNSLVHH